MECYDNDCSCIVVHLPNSEIERTTAKLSEVADHILYEVAIGLVSGHTFLFRLPDVHNR